MNVVSNRKPMIKFFFSMRENVHECFYLDNKHDWLFYLVVLPIMIT